MNVMLLRQAAVFMNAGSYVIIPNSSGAALICRRSVARIVPSWTGISYCLPVRLSIMVSVSGMKPNREVLRVLRVLPVLNVLVLRVLEVLAVLALSVC